ncbi:sulfatase [Carboxylicivirga marina]|uniref:Sulfatase n=1 Tax=Carboxylicivirga marina TaxID=2800988 RepID=A0ABS1HKL6_9BACT|nr:sulfatase [Carboxylicivirga marina]MBK3518223.1 sulfatase [Carboxylicivirga marina]
MKKWISLIVLTIAFNLNAQERPNVLFIAIDDMKPLTGSYGADFMVTPHMDELANSGVIFTNAHCQQAVCGPSRASIMTGMRPDYTGVWDLKTRMRDVNPDILAMPEFFKNNGYETVAVGKIYDPRCVDKEYDKPSWSIPYKESSKYIYPAEYGEPGLSYYALKDRKEKVHALEAEARKKGVNVHKYVSDRFKPSVEMADVPDEAYIDGQIANNAIKYIDQFSKEKSKPFFLGVGFKRPHLPFAAPTKYWELYKRDEIELAKYPYPVKDGVNMAYHNSGELQSYTDIPPLSSFTDINTMELPDDKQKELIHGYYAAISYIDAQVGKVMAKLKETGLDKNTVVVLWGDHGWHLGDHSMWCKHSNFEQATRVPLIITAPGFEAGTYAHPAEFIDVFPTLCELSGLKTPSQLQGLSLVPAFKDNDEMVKPVAVSQFNRGKKKGYSIRSDRFRLTLWMKDGWNTSKPLRGDEIVAGELYDYQMDELETTNLYNKAKYETVKRQLVQVFIDFVIQQNSELKTSSTSSATENKSKVENKSTIGNKPTIEIGTTFDDNWGTIERKGAKADFTIENEVLVANVEALGENSWDLQMKYKKGLELKAGTTLVLKLYSKGPEMKINLGPVDNYRITRKLPASNGKKEQIIRFTVEKDGTYPVKLSFTGTGEYHIWGLRTEIK